MEYMLLAIIALLLVAVVLLVVVLLRQRSLTHLQEQQNRRISAQMDSMAHQRQQLDAILGGMREGLIILDHRRLVLTMNAAARDMLGTADDASGCALSAIDHRRQQPGSADPQPGAPCLHQPGRRGRRGYPFAGHDQ